MFQIGFYRQFFDINTEEFFGKIKLALNPFNNVSAVSGVNEDLTTELYGFIWITATLIFLMFVSSTGSNIVSHWLHSGKDDAAYEYSFLLLISSILVFYGYTLVVPFLLFAVTTWIMKFERPLSLTRLISIYSYANVLWFPITWVNFVLVVFVSSSKHHAILNGLQWAIVTISGGISGLSIVLKVRPIIIHNTVGQNAEDNVEGLKRQRLVVFSLVAVHLVFTVLVKVLFFGIEV